MPLNTSPLSAIELRLLAQDWLAKRHPDATIVTELSVGNWGSASIDIAAITDSHIIGVEIKGEGDSPTRLDRQGLAYGMVAKEMWLLPSPCSSEKTFKHRPPCWGRLEVFDDAVRPFNRATKTDYDTKIPTRHGGVRHPVMRDDSRYKPEPGYIGGHLSPQKMLETLWKDELYNIARRQRIEGVTKRTAVHVISDLIEAELPAPMIHDEMITELRSREWKKDVIDLRTPEGRHIASGKLVA